MNEKFDFELLASDALKVLKILYDNAELQKDTLLCCKMSQMEIVKKSNFCKSKINQIVINLKKQGYVVQNNYSKYIITEKTKALFAILTQ